MQSLTLHKPIGGLFLEIRESRE